jgi:hypothetical protein
VQRGGVEGSEVETGMTARVSDEKRSVKEEVSRLMALRATTWRPRAMCRDDVRVAVAEAQPVPRGHPDDVV